MKYTLDTEFHDDGRTIDLISMGIVAEDGREYYAVNLDCEWFRVGQHKWLMENVVPHLPEPEGGRQAWNVIDKLHADVKAYDQIAVEVEQFLNVGLGMGENAETWAYFSAHDHVALTQLFGPMVMAPQGVPMRTSCLKQEEERRRQRIRDNRRSSVPEGLTLDVLVERLLIAQIGERPVQDKAEEHHGLFDARYDMRLARWLGVIG